MWNCIASLAARQQGLVARRQLIEDLGCRPGQIDGLVRRGRLVRAGHGVYAIAGTPTSPLSEVMATVLRSGPGARAVGDRLLAACGVRDAAEDGSYSILVPAGRRLRRATHPWREDLHPSLGITASVRGVPSFSIPRNLLEAAVDVDCDERVMVLADGVRRASRRHVAAVQRLLVRRPGHAGGRRLLLLGCLDVDAAESQPERLLEVLLTEFSPRRQVRLTPGIRVDFLIESARVVVEYDGSDHESGRAREADARRDEELRALGYVVIRVTRVDMRTPGDVLARVRAACAR